MSYNVIINAEAHTSALKVQRLTSSGVGGFTIINFFSSIVSVVTTEFPMATTPTWRKT